MTDDDKAQDWCSNKLPCARYETQAAELEDQSKQIASQMNVIYDISVEVQSLRELLAAAYIELSGKDEHASDCATSNAPAMMPGRCDCD